MVAKPEEHRWSSYRATAGFERAPAWLDVANPGRGEGARAQLAVVLGYVGARVVPAACIHLALERNDGVVRIAPAALPDLVSAVTALLGS